MTRCQKSDTKVSETQPSHSQRRVTHQRWNSATGVSKSTTHPSTVLRKKHGLMQKWNGGCWHWRPVGLFGLWRGLIPCQNVLVSSPYVPPEQNKEASSGKVPKLYSLMTCIYKFHLDSDQRSALTAKRWRGELWGHLHQVFQSTVRSWENPLK